MKTTETTMINESLSLTLSSSLSLFSSTPSTKSTQPNSDISNLSQISKSNRNTPILTDLLTSSLDMIPYVFDFQPLTIQEQELTPIVRKQVNKRKKSKSLDQFCLTHLTVIPSLKLDDYFIVQPEHTKAMELAGCDNSLFLALARSFLYKFYFENKKYEFIIRLFCLNNLNSKFKLDSDVTLQQVIRKKLCYYWLSFISEGKFVKNCKYSK